MVYDFRLEVEKWSSDVVSYVGVAHALQVWEHLQLASQTESHVKMDPVFHQSQSQYFQTVKT